MLFSGEITLKRVNYINRLLSVGKEEVLRVLRVDTQKGFIDLSKKQVKTDEIDEALVICGYRLNDMSFRELHDNLPENYKLLLIASAGRIAEITDNGIMSLKMPLSRSEFVDTISMIFAEDRKAKKAKRNQPRKHSDEEKEIINKAKSILMDRNNMTESEAHRYIQKNSMNSGTSLVEMAEMIIRLSRT